MRKILFLILVAASLTGCRTNENNMRQAYDRTMAAAAAGVDQDSTIYTKIRRQFKKSDIVIGGDTIASGTQHVAITPDGGGIPEYIKTYMVVAGQFKQVFNARMMRERLTENGYPGAFVVQTREPYYYVVAGSTTDPNQAKELVMKLRADQQLRLKSPLPFILRPAGR